MTDPETFEARLADAFARYVEPAPVAVNATAMAASVGVTRHRAAGAWSAARLAVVGALLLVALLVAALIGTGGNLPRLLSEVAPSPTQSAPPTAAPTSASVTETPSASPRLITASSETLAAGEGRGTIVFSPDCLNRLDVATGALTQNCDRNLYTHPSGTFEGSWSWSPDGLRAIGDGDNTMLVMRDAASNDRRPIAGTEFTIPPRPSGDTGPVSFPASFLGWSPKGTYIVWVGETSGPGAWGVYLGPPDDPRRSLLPSPDDGGSWCCVQWSNDESRAIVPTDPDTGAPGSAHATVVAGDGSSLPGAIVIDRTAFLGFSPDGRGLAILAPRGPAGAPVAIDVATSDGFAEPRNVTSFPDGVYARVAGWSADGSTLAIVTDDTPADRAQTPYPNFRLWLIGAAGSARSVPISIPSDFSQKAQLQGAANPWSLTWSADGTHVLVTSVGPAESSLVHATIFSTVDGSATVTGASVCVLSPDGRFAACELPESNGRRDVVLVELATGRTRALTSPTTGFGRSGETGLFYGFSLVWLP